MSKLLVQGGLVVAAVLALGAGGFAQDRSGPSYAYGIRTGFGLDPDQFVIGAQAKFGRFGGIARVEPTFDVGFGDKMTTYLLNADLRLDILPLPKSETVVYGGFGPTLAYFDFNGGGDFPDDSDTEIGLNLTTGVELPMGRSNSYNFEARFGIGDIPEFRLLLGVYFGGGGSRSDALDSE